MNKQSWKTAVEIVGEFRSRHYVRIIEDGVVSIKAFDSHTEAETFAASEKARLEIVPSR
ncbi:MULTISPECIES: hypothetical protein [unclassified Mesorhizobium]|uniref:hypothetical protein n=1 Tax=unclassified Mesorhizobium TaxID=325217 RepID=UPI0015965C39|nr:MULTISPECIES: hypothetical protein [unclassified Mesorhizobium]